MYFPNINVGGRGFTPQLPCKARILHLKCVVRQKCGSLKMWFIKIVVHQNCFSNDYLFVIYSFKYLYKMYVTQNLTCRRTINACILIALRINNLLMVVYKVHKNSHILSQTRNALVSLFFIHFLSSFSILCGV